jgi:hypothetical protein
MRPAARAGPVALVMFGLSGLLILAAGLAAVIAWDGVSDPPGGDPVAHLRATLAASRTAVVDVSAAARSVDAGLASAAEAAWSAGVLMRDLADAFRGVASVLRTPVLGGEPFAPAAPAFEHVAERAAALAADLSTVRTVLSAGGDDLGVVSDQLTELGRRMAGLDGAIDTTAARLVDSATGLRILAAALLAWLAVPAAGAIWLGLWLHARAPR